MIININQISTILVLIRDNLIYEVKSSKQVLIYNKDKKYVFTNIILVIEIEKILAIQSI